MSAANLQDILDRSGNVVDLLRNSQVGAYIYPHEQFPVRAVVSPVPYSEVARTEYHNGWRTKQIAAA